MIHRYLVWLGYGDAPRSLRVCMLALTVLIPLALVLATANIILSGV